MLSSIFPSPTFADKKIFHAAATADGVGWQRYDIPTNATMLSILALAGGGGGGNGARGAVSTAAGGGGGGSSGQTYLLIPTSLLPKSLYICVGFGGASNTAGVVTRISVYPDTIANHCLVIANPGQPGGNGSGATAGAAGTAGSVATIATMPLAYMGFPQFLAGSAGVIGGTTVAAGALTLPTTGQITTGGSGGGGLPASGAGTAGGAITSPDTSLWFPSIPAAAGGSATTVPGVSGSNGINFINGMLYFYGGAGGGSTNAAATGAGIFAGNGGRGGYGCGGGGGGGGLTGSGNGFGGEGGEGLVIVEAW